VPVIDLLTFDVGGRRLALRAETVRHVVRAVAVEPLPAVRAAAAMLDGVINVHGAIVPVISLRRRFGLPDREVSPDQQFVLADTGGRVVALRVDLVFDLRSVPADAVAGIDGRAPRVEQVAGVARLPDGLVVIYDLEQLLSADEALKLDTALGGALSGTDA